MGSFSPQKRNYQNRPEEMSEKKMLEHREDITQSEGLQRMKRVL
jgi:hypothetical protein